MDPVGRLQHLGQCADGVPREVGLERNRVRRVDHGVFRVAAIDRASEPAHHRRDLLAWYEFDTVADGIDDADELDAEDPREREVRAGLALTAGDFGFVDAEGLHLDAHVPGAGTLGSGLRSV